MNPKIKAAFLLASQVGAAYGLRSKLREARDKNDRLALLDAAVSAAGLLTGSALAVRALRKGDEES